MEMDKPVNQLITDIYLLDIDDDAIIMTKKLNDLTEDFIEIIENDMDIKNALTIVHEYALKDDEKFARNFALLFTSKQILEYNGNVIRNELLKVLQNNYKVYAKKTFMMSTIADEYLLLLPADDIAYYNSITLLGECYNRLRSNENVPYEFMGNALFDLITTKLKLILEFYERKPTETIVDVRFIKVILNQILLNGALAKSEHNEQIELLFTIIRRCVITIIELTDMMKAFFMMTMELYYKNFKSLGNETEIFYAKYLYDYEREFNHLKQYKISANIVNLNHTPAMTLTATTTATSTEEWENEIVQSNENVVVEMNLMKLKKEVDGFKRGLKKYVPHNKDDDISSSSSNNNSTDGRNAANLINNNNNNNNNNNGKKANKKDYPQKPLKLTDRLRFIQLNANSSVLNNTTNNIGDEIQLRVNMDVNKASNSTNCNIIPVLTNNDIISRSSPIIGDFSKNDGLNTILTNNICLDDDDDDDDGVKDVSIINNRITSPPTVMNDYYVIKTVENVVNQNYNIISSNENEEEKGQTINLLKHREMNITDNELINKYRNKNGHTKLENNENRNDRLQMNNSVNKSDTEINSTNNKHDDDDDDDDDHNKDDHQEIKLKPPRQLFSTLYSDRLTVDDRAEYYYSSDNSENHNNDRIDYKSLHLRNKLPQYKKQQHTQRSFSSSSIPSPSPSSLSSKPNYYQQKRGYSNPNRIQYQQQNERNNFNCMNYPEIDSNTKSRNNNSMYNRQQYSDNKNNIGINITDVNLNYNNRNNPNNNRRHQNNNNNNFNKNPDDKRGGNNKKKNNRTNNYHNNNNNTDNINNRSTSLQNNYCVSQSHSSSSLPPPQQ